MRKPKNEQTLKEKIEAAYQRYHDQCYIMDGDGSMDSDQWISDTHEILLAIADKLADMEEKNDE